MAEYINREDVIDALYAKRQDITNIWCRTVITECVEEIQELPSADVQPVKHGEWSQIKILQDGYKAKECSACKATFWDLYHWNYCPNCGARMDGEE